MRVSLHLPQARLSVLEGLGGAVAAGPENLDMSSVLRPEVLARSLPRLMPPYKALGVSGLLGSGPVPETTPSASALSGWLSGSRMPEGDWAGESETRLRSRLCCVSSDCLRRTSLNMRAGHPQNPPGAWLSG